MLRFILGYLQWVLYRTIGLFWTAIVCLQVLFVVIRKPKKLLATENWNAQRVQYPVENVTHVHFDVGEGLSIHAVRTGGAPTKPVMVLVHGFPEYWGSWRYQIEEFRTDYDVVAIDMRGYSLSSKPAGIHNYRLDKLVNDLATVIKALNVDKVTLVAHDWGANVAWCTAAVHPELIDKLVILACPHPSNFKLSAAQFLRSWYMFFFMTPLVPEWCYQFDNYHIVDGIFGDLIKKGRFTQADADRYKRELARPGVLTAIINYYRALMYSITADPPKEVFRALKQKIKPPTLLLWASHDVALGLELVPGTEKYVENLTVHVVDDCSHWIQQDKPEEVNSVIRDFLKN